MKTHELTYSHKFLLLAASLGSALLLAGSAAAAESAVLLEGFEESIDAAVPVSGRTTLASYTAQPDDPFVTQGSRSLEITLSEAEFWQHDINIIFSEEASQRLREAAASTDVARYILRFDYIFPPSGYTSWMNVQVGGWGRGDQLESNNGLNTMSLPLDLIGALPEEGEITMSLNHNFDAMEDPFTSLQGYLDNIRLVDTYAPGAQPVVYSLQSFEDPENPIGGAEDFTGWGGGTRTTYSQHTSTGPDDVRVSEGNHSLRVDYGQNNWMADFTIPFAGTKLAEVLQLDLPVEERPSPESLARYTLRWETIYPARNDEVNVGSWINTSYNTLASGTPWSQGGGFGDFETTGFPRTYSITLDQIASWSESPEGAPVLMFIANGDWSEPGIPIYYDNFRLFDTGAVGDASAPRVSSFQFNPSTSSITLTWESVAGTTYAIESTTELGSGWPTVVAPSIPATGTTTTFTGTVTSAPQTFFRIRAVN